MALIVSAALVALLLMLRPGPAAALGGAPPGLPPQVLDAGAYHTCALTPTGAADCWGSDFLGRATDQTGPYVQLSAGTNHTCALTPAGAADCWANIADQPGPYTQVSAGDSHTCALTPSGAADCWGDNSSGQADDQPGPYTQVSAGQIHTCALTPGGSVDCWGTNVLGHADDQPGPYTQVSAGTYHTCALTPAGAADCWGYNNSSQATDQPGPYSEVSVGLYHTCALTLTGAVDCWGSNSWGAADDQPGPYTQVSTHGEHTCALTPAGAVDCWGRNDAEQGTDQPGPYRPYEADEPDDTPAQAAQAFIGSTTKGNFIGVAGDVDYYYITTPYTNDRIVIEVEAAAIGSDMDSVLTLYASDGTTVLAENDDYGSLDSRIAYTLPNPGTYYVRVREYSDPDEGGPRYFYNLVLRSLSVYVSSTASGTTGGVAATPQDILRYDFNTGQWEMSFDGSDVGVTKALNAFARLPGGDWLLVFKANQPTPAGTFTPWDVARFSPTVLGVNTTGTFSWHIDGSDIGLTTTAEKIDALDVTPQGALLISTSGALAVPNPGGGTLKMQDEDLAIFYPASLGATTAGEWYAYFNGTAVPGMGVEDLNAVNFDPVSGDIFAGITGAFKIGGVSGNGKDILQLMQAAVPGGYAVQKVIAGPAIGFNLLLSGFEMD
jgi:hypothetical protein